MASNLPLMVAHGFASVAIEDEDTKLPVEIVAVEKSRSKTTQTIKVKTARNAQVTLAVVDEGILQLKNFKTPDIHGFFYQKRALEVGSFDLYPFLFPELSLASSSVGGDGYDLEKRVNPLSNGRVQLVSFWSGHIDAGMDGEAELEVQIPQFSGDLRIMAVAYKGNAFGASNKNMKVADPIVISTALPRFLSPDDEIIVPVNVTNTEKTAANVTASVTIGGKVLSLVGAAAQKLNVAPDKEVRTNFVIKAARAVGSGSVVVTVNNGKEKFIEKTEITVRPASSLLKGSMTGVIAGGTSGSINFANDFIPSTVKNKMIFSRSPMIQYGKALDYLLGYPHGCVEQTVSKAFPQLYFADLSKLIAPKTALSNATASEMNPTANVQAAIQKLESMQLPNGALSYWPGSADESEWGTAYAAHFLIEAKRAGYEINQNTLVRILDYLNTKTSTPSTENDYRWNESGGYSMVAIASRTSIYSLYVLALSGKPNRASMNYYKQNNGTLTEDSRYLLAAAYKQIGDGRSHKSLSPPKFNAEPAGASRWFSGSFSSPIRNLALTANSLLETDADNLQLPMLMRQLSQAVATSSYLNTQEASFSFLALGKWAKRQGANSVTASIAMDGKKYNFDGKDLMVRQFANGNGTVSTTGKGALYWFAQAEGLSATGNVVQEDVNLRVRKAFLNRNGQPISTFRQNDLVVVRITLSSSAAMDVENVVVTDMLPACFEVEHPRLTEPRDMPWMTNVAQPNHFDVRDDRINYFTTATGTEKTFYYMVRVITKGTFTLGPVSADAMYSSDYRSYWGAGKLKVE